MVGESLRFSTTNTAQETICYEDWIFGGLNPFQVRCTPLTNQFLPVAFRYSQRDRGNNGGGRQLQNRCLSILPIRGSSHYITVLFALTSFAQLYQLFRHRT
jgi:hypothetical protein